MVRLEKASLLSDLDIDNSAGVYSETTGIYIANGTRSSSIEIRDVQAAGKHGMVSLDNNITLKNTSLFGRAIAYQAFKTSISMFGGSLSSKIPDRVFIGGSNFVIKESFASLDDVYFSGSGFAIGPRHISANNSDISIKNSTFGFSENTSLASAFGDSTIKICNSEFTGNYTNIIAGGQNVPNASVTCLNTFNTNILAELTLQCQNP